MDPERTRLTEIRDRPWRKWGPYLSERQWGTVREDYSHNGDAWNYFPHDHARSRAYRWGEDGLGGISDDRQILCFALALWNGNDPILKERLFGLTNPEGNHGEDVKEYYFYLDSTPTHSYMKYLYKYPQQAYPYNDLVQTNRQRGRHEPEYELIDTGVFDGDRYFDVFVEYAKETPEDILVRITVHNRSSAPAEIHVLPTLWYRNQWSWGGGEEKPRLERMESKVPYRAIHASDKQLGDRWLWCEGDAPLLFTENETNTARLVGGANASPYTKDGINEYIVHGQQDAVNPNQVGTKAAAHYRATVQPGSPLVIRLRLTETAQRGKEDLFGRRFDGVMTNRLHEADEFYAALVPANLDAEAKRTMRQALAGMLWSKQFYLYDLDRWLKQRRTPSRPPLGRNYEWHHMTNADVISMPDKWEYPWYAAWDLAFHALPLSIIDPDFARDQLNMMLRDRYLHPNGQLPAYEWNFSDVNPPVHAWAMIFTYRLLQTQEHTDENRRWLEHAFQKLLLNFTWWVNRKDRAGHNVFEGGFLGLDNIGVFDRSAPLPTGGYLEQADGTAWMAFYTQTMCDIAMTLHERDPGYEDMVLKFVEHFLWIASAMMRIGDGGQQLGMWDEEDGFFYDVLRFPDGGATRLKVRSVVGLLPLCAATVFEGGLGQKMPEAAQRFREFVEARPEIVGNIHDLRKPGQSDRRLLSILDEKRLRRVLAHMLDENEFFSPYGIRSLSRYHAEHPYVFRVGDQEYRVSYLPGESDTGMFGGNSNWRGPIWMPINALIIRALLMYYRYYGDNLRVECPTGSGRMMNLYEVAQELARRLTAIFVPGADGRRPVFGKVEKFHKDPHWRDCIPFYEYFDGDTGAGLGASHQTGWTGVIARAIHLFATTTPEGLLKDLGEAFPARPAAQKERRVAERRRSAVTA